MEVSISDFGGMMFDMMTRKKVEVPDHWASIRDKAKPLIGKLLELNEEMTKDGKRCYDIVGAKDKKTGKKKLSKRARIKKAQEKLWKVKASTLKEGDCIWLVDNYDHEMYVGETEPVVVGEVTKKGVYVEMSHCGGSHTERIDFDETVLKAPDEYQLPFELARKLKVGEITYEQYAIAVNSADEIIEKLESDEYWLEQADKLGF